MSEQGTSGETFRRLGPAGPLAIAFAIFPVVGSIFLFRSMGEIGSWLRSLDPVAPLAYAAGFAVFAGMALLPTYALSALGGWVFGMPVGLPAALAGIAGASVIGYLLSRRASGDRVLRVIAEKPRWEAIRRSLVGSGPLKTLAIVTLIRVPPNSPFALSNLVLASVRVPLWIYLTATVVGIAPRTALAVYIASGIEELTKDTLESARPAWFFGATIGVSLVVVLILGGLANRALERLGQGSPASGEGTTKEPNA